MFGKRRFIRKVAYQSQESSHYADRRIDDLKLDREQLELALASARNEIDKATQATKLTADQKKFLKA